MLLSISELALARETVQSLLDELHLTAYQFDVEPRADGWTILVECQAGDAWQVTQMNASKAMLANAQADSNTRQALLAELTKTIADCSRLR
ncbi:MAG: hypothetical protein WAN46_19395 [Gammaproteobacteria bacterium]|jgi:hypothetical protein